MLNATSGVAQQNALIRQATLEELPHLVTFQQTMAQESEGLALDLETLTLGIQRMFNQPELGGYWVIVCPETNTLLGMCLVLFEWSDWRNTFQWWIHSLYILPDCRGQGLLDTLVEVLSQHAEESGASELRLYVYHGNDRAIRAYQRLGFQDDHYKMMQKQLSPSHPTV